MIWTILYLLVDIFVFLYVLVELIMLIRNAKYQKIWEREKALRLRVDPAITRAELCEYYVMFCKRNDCKVEF